METVYLVMFQYYDDFAILEIFKSRASAECYIGNFPYGDDDRYTPENLFIHEMILRD